LQITVHPEEAKPYILSVYSPPKSKRPWHFRELAGGRPLNYFAFGRGALVEALRLCGVGNDDTVLIPSYICRDVLASLHAVCATPLYYPVERDLQADLDPDSAPPAKAVLSVNYFGFPQKLDVFQRYCAQVGAYLIEDNAHGLFGRDEEGRLLGTRTDVGVFSLRKTIPLPNGAALAVNRTDLNDRVSEQEPFEASPADIFFGLKQAVRRLVGLFGVQSARVVISILRMRRWIMTGSLSPLPDPLGEIVLPEPSKCTPLIRAGIRTAHPKLESERRRKLYLFLDEWIGGHSKCTPVFNDLPDLVVPYGYPFLCEADDLKSIERLLFKRGFLCISWPDLPDAVRKDSPAFYKKIRLVPFLW
jgi:hypothetical protein